MAITREMIQGFLDGHKAAGHKEGCIKLCTEKYLKGHRNLPQEDEIKNIIEDILSYRK